MQFQLHLHPILKAIHPVRFSFRISLNMARTNSTMLELGTTLPNFDLSVANGSKNRLQKEHLNNTPVLLMIICSHCPFVKHVEPEITRLEADYGSKIQLIGVSCNSLITHPQDSPENLNAQAKALNWSFPYLFDENQSLAKSLRAACTPEFYLFASEEVQGHTLRYRGQLDSSRPGNESPLNGKDLRGAIDAVLNNRTVSDIQIPSLGCNVKWHPGKEPSWYGQIT